MIYTLEYMTMKKGSKQNFKINIKIKRYDTHFQNGKYWDVNLFLFSFSSLKIHKKIYEKRRF